MHWQLSGRFCHGDLCGVVTETDPQDGSVTERLYEAGLTCGTYRHRRLDGQLLAFGNSVQGVKVKIYIENITETVKSFSVTSRLGLSS